MASRRPQSARRLPPEGPAWPREGTEKAIEGLKMAALKRTDYIHNPRRGSTAWELCSGHLGPSWALLAPLGLIFGHSCSQLAIQDRLLALPSPKFELQRRILQDLLRLRSARDIVPHTVFACFAAYHLRDMLFSTSPYGAPTTNPKNPLRHPEERLQEP